MTTLDNSTNKCFKNLLDSGGEIPMPNNSCLTIPQIFHKEQKENSEILHFNFAGCSAEDIHVSLVGNSLIVSGPSFIESSSPQQYSLSLSPNDDTNHLSINFNSGKLSITIPYKTFN